MSVAAEFETANAEYAASFTKGDLALPPQRYGKYTWKWGFVADLYCLIRKVAIVACMDARLGKSPKSLSRSFYSREANLFF